jgi:hypothetical protein
MGKNESLRGIRIVLVHSLPGRFRVRLEPRPEEATWLALHGNVAACHGVSKVCASRRTGSILVFYKPNQIDFKEILALFQKPDLFLQPVSEHALLRQDKPGMTQGGLLVSGIKRLLPISSILLRSLLPRGLRLVPTRSVCSFLVKGSEALSGGKANIVVSKGLELQIFKESERLKAGLQARAEQRFDMAVPATIVLSLLTFFLTRNLNRAVSVLLMDFSFAIKLSTPPSLFSRMRKASGTFFSSAASKWPGSW